MDFEKFQAINNEKRNIGTMTAPSVMSTYKNEACGDDFIVYLRIEDRVITNASFVSTGCGFGIAALSIATEWVKGKSLDEAEGITENDVDAGLGGFPERRINYPRTAVVIIKEVISKYRDSVGI